MSGYKQEGLHSFCIEEMFVLSLLWQTAEQVFVLYAEGMFLDEFKYCRSVKKRIATAVEFFPMPCIIVCSFEPVCSLKRTSCIYACLVFELFWKRCCLKLQYIIAKYWLKSSYCVACKAVSSLIGVLPNGFSEMKGHFLRIMKTSGLSV